MARHRNIRTINYENEMYAEDEDLSKSFKEDDFSISPSTANQYLYDRISDSDQTYRNADILTEKFQETLTTETQNEEQKDCLKNAKLYSCMDYIQDCVGDTIPEEDIIEAINKSNYDAQTALNILLKRNDQHLKKEIIETNLLEKASENSNLSERKNTPKVKNKPQTKIKSELNSGFKNTKNIKSKDEIMKIYEKERLIGKLQLNMAVIGHVDAGKSTIMGHLLSILGMVSKKNMHKNENEAKKAGKASFMYAWVLDETEEERKRGITIDVGNYRFETEQKIINILDAPGHRDFIPNMISGITQADVAVLVVDATNGEFETGFESGGQTQEHILLSRSLGLSQLAVVVNKLDNVKFEKKRYDEIVKKIDKFLKQVGFKDESIQYVPCSGLTGENLVELSKNVLWYKGPTLVETIDGFVPNKHSVTDSFRMTVNDVFKGQTSGIVLYGRIDAGYVELNQKLLIMPTNEICTVKNIIIEEKSYPYAFAGDIVLLNVLHSESFEIFVGNVLCDIFMPCTLASKFEARIITFGNTQTLIIKGFSALLYSANLINEVACITKLCSLIDKNSNDVIKKNPRLLGRNSAGFVEITLNREVCLETFYSSKKYGRFILRSENLTIGFGIVTKILAST